MLMGCADDPVHVHWLAPVQVCTDCWLMWLMCVGVGGEGGAGVYNKSGMQQHVLGVPEACLCVWCVCVVCAHNEFRYGLYASRRLSCSHLI
jgi:hypothetical protein